MSKASFYFKLTVTLLRIFIGSCIQSGYKLEPGLGLCSFKNLVVVLLEGAPYFSSAIIKADCDSGVKRAEGKKAKWGNPLQNFGCSIQLVKMIKYEKELSEVTPCKIPVVVFSWIA